MRGAKKTTQVPDEPILTEYENFLQHFPQRSVVRNGKNGSAIFPSRSWVKDELTREKVKKKHLTRDEKVTFDY